MCFRMKTTTSSDEKRVAQVPSVSSSGSLGFGVRDGNFREAQSSSSTNISELIEGAIADGFGTLAYLRWIIQPHTKSISMAIRYSYTIRA